MKSEEVKFDDLKKGLVIYEATENFIKKVTIVTPINKIFKLKRDSYDSVDYIYQKLEQIEDIETAPIHKFPPSGYYRFDFTINDRVFCYFNLLAAVIKFKKMNEPWYRQVEKFYNDVVKLGYNHE